ncbi:hypothetical protein HK103_002336 [Boothiomyces macroporosus]|uniref:Uncharacterized protein n=1 Tax=Boothiomyces macroporosus TaxID=261099 RepID=A0AAD5Y4U1_9FUNG|nr:hypothetical protein HK103_002313 [Boothiomyces macroporosus]KAJ3259433.1 hypothetical protein HK103_002336 [Boothiomyces macroporosus]
MDDGAVAIASAIIESKLEVLELMENQIGRLGFEALINSLPKTKLTELAMLGNEYNADDIQLVFQMLPNCKLNRWSEDRSITIATQKKLIDNLASSQLTYLDLNITPIMIPSLLEASANSKLTAICFRSNDGDSLCSKIAENIHNLYFTEIIFLSYTHMTAKSVGMLFQALQKNSSLTTIILPGKIGNTGVKEISRYFGDTAISSLSIIDGTLDDDSFPYFFHIISTGKLKYLQVSDNKFSEVCIAKFRIASIEFNFHLLL